MDAVGQPEAGEEGVDVVPAVRPAMYEVGEVALIPRSELCGVGFVLRWDDCFGGHQRLAVAPRAGLATESGCGSREQYR